MEWIFLVLTLIFLAAALAPVLAQRRVRLARLAALRSLEKDLGARVITMIHRQERGGLFNRPTPRMITMDDSQAVIGAIEETPDDKPIAFILHTPGGVILPATQIARALKSHPAKTTVYVPVWAMSGGTLIALGADEIVMAPFATLGPLDPQIVGAPGPSLLRVREEKPIQHVNDITLILADVAEKLIAELHGFIVELTADRLGEARANELADRLTVGEVTHGFPIMADRARALGMPVSDDLPETVRKLMTLYPQPPTQTPSVETVPAEEAARALGQAVRGGQSAANLIERSREPITFR